MTTQEFLDKYNGVGIDFDGFYGNQCMDEFLQYNQDVVNAPRVYGNAVDVWTTYPKAFYTQIPNTPENFPQLGDVIIWGTGIGQYGHIAICKEADVNSFTSLDQNWDNVQYCQFVKHNYNAVLGWIRPILQPSTPSTPPLEGLSIQVGYNPTFEGQDVMVNGVHYKAIKDNGNLIWKIEPPQPLSNTVNPDAASLSNQPEEVTPTTIPVTVSTTAGSSAVEVPIEMPSPVKPISTPTSESATQPSVNDNVVSTPQSDPQNIPQKSSSDFASSIVIFLKTIFSTLQRLWMRKNA